MPPTPIRINSVNTSPQRGTAKAPLPEATVDARGIVGDAHAGDWHRQVSVLAQESIDRFVREAGRPVRPGEFGENLIIEGADLAAAGLLDRLRFEHVELELTQKGKACHGDRCAIFQQAGRCIMPTEGVFCRVIHGGPIRRGEPGQYLPKVLRVLVVTLSDRAAAGVYADRSGPRIRELLADHFAHAGRPVEVRNVLLGDDPPSLLAELAAAREGGTDAVITTGGTGLGPRDGTPEVLTAFCDKLIPGIMEHIRLKFGRDNPRALLSRSVAGLAGAMQLYALPGSVRAVEEYMGEILTTFEHVLYTVHGLDVHSPAGGG
jgi:molybdenum cofactor synthesis domain-containing protein